MTRRASIWLCLILAVVTAIVPSAGLVVCLGSDGHLGVGAVSTAEACPCAHHDHEDELEDATSSIASADDQPCVDLALESVVVVHDCARSPFQADPWRDLIGGPLGAAEFPWSPPNDLLWPEPERSDTRPLGPAPCVSQVLRHRRAVVLLI